MIGYEVTATSKSRGYVRTIDGWFEGNPTWEAKAKEFAAKQLLKGMLSALAGGPVVKVADLVSKPLQILGSAVGEFIAQQMLVINRARGNQGLQIYDLNVTLTGDFEAAYRIADSGDLDSLPPLLALLPEKGTDDEFMGAGVMEAVFMSHVNFARYLYNAGGFEFDTAVDLEIKIDL